MKSLKNMTGDSLEQMIDYKVVDQNGATIGTLHSLWSDPTTGGVEFLGVKTGWLFGHNHVVPAEKAELDEAENVVRLPYTEVFIKEAPSMAADAEISEMEEDTIYQYYGLPSPTHAEIGVSALDAGRAIDADPAAARWRRTGGGDEARLPSMPADDAGAEHANPDPLTGEPGAHPVATGIGAASAGLAGLAIGGAVGGPIGAPLGAAIGGVAGAVGGGLTGKGIAEVVNPTDEEAFWASEYRHASYYEEAYDYADYAPAYRVGYEGFGQYGPLGRDYAEVEPDLERQYTQSRGNSKLGWDKASAATRDAWTRLKDKFSAAQ